MEDAAPAETVASRTGPLSGYMDFHINDAQHADPVLDFHRFVLLISHRFSERVHFVSEIELEHAVVSPETGGELELEQAYVDFRISRPFNLRAGMVLAPVGIINERHEPPVFHGVERPLVETVIHPDHVVRRRGGDPRRGARRPPLPRVRDGDARRHPLQRRTRGCGKDARRAPNRTRGTSRAPGASSTSARRA